MGTRKKRRSVVGVISDTHGLLRPGVLTIFQDVDLIIHAGDIGNPEVLDSLRPLAPIVAVRGNNDTGAWAKKIPEIQLATVGEVRFYVLHNLKELKEDIAAKHIAAVISGHSHRPTLEVRDAVLFLNPGSAGPRRFKLPISVARLIVDGSAVQGQIIEVPLS